MRVEVLLLAVLVATPALADHVYTHRYVVSGRLTDAAGAPVAGARVEVEVNGISSARGDCRAYPFEVRGAVMHIADTNFSNGFGDFEACVHAHTLSAQNLGRMRVGAGPWRNLTIDPGIRLTFASARLEEAAGGNASWNSTLLLRARVWRPSPSALILDRVDALGEALAERRVQVEIPGVLRRNLTTDPYGDTAAYVPLGDVREGVVTFTTGGAPPLSVPFNATDLRAEAVLFVDADLERVPRGLERQGGIVIPGFGLLALITALLLAARWR